MIKMRIDAKFKITGRGYFVGVRPLNKNQEWEISSNARLGDFELKPVLEIPRKILENGQPDMNIFALQLKHESDFDTIQEGEILELNYR